MVAAGHEEAVKAGPSGRAAAASCPQQRPWPPPPPPMPAAPQPANSVAAEVRPVAARLPHRRRGSWRRRRSRRRCGPRARRRRSSRLSGRLLAGGRRGLEPRRRRQPAPTKPPRAVRGEAATGLFEAEPPAVRPPPGVDHPPTAQASRLLQPARPCLCGNHFAGATLTLFRLDGGDVYLCTDALVDSRRGRRSAGARRTALHCWRSTPAPGRPGTATRRPTTPSRRRHRPSARLRSRAAGVAALSGARARPARACATAECVRDSKARAHKRTLNRGSKRAALRWRDVVARCPGRSGTRRRRRTREVPAPRSQQTANKRLELASSSRRA